MTEVQTLAGNPFAMMLNPQDILQAIEGSSRLEGLQRRVCRPLDRPLIPKSDGQDVDAFDRDVESAPDEAPEICEPDATI
jgi:hypothetical protein